MFDNSQEIIKKFTVGIEDNKKDYLLRENSNFVYSLSLLRHNIDNFEEEKYLMENIFTKELKDLYEEKVIYVHDKKLAPYCNSVSCLTIATIGVPTISKNMLSSKPTKKIGTFFRQLSNLVTMISQQSSGAIMLSQMTTILAGYLYYTEKELNKKISDEDLVDLWYNFIWEVNLPLRSGCVDCETELLTPNGFKKYHELKIGEEIYTWNNGALNIQPIQKMNIFDHDGEMHEYSGRDYIQFVTPNHRVIRQKNNSKDFEIKHSEDIFDEKTPPTFPIAMLENNIGGLEMSDEFIELLVFILTDGYVSDDGNRVSFYKSERRWGNERFEELIRFFNIKCKKHTKISTFNGCKGENTKEYFINHYRFSGEFGKKIKEFLNNTKKEIPKALLEMNKRQAKLFIDTWTKLDGNIDESFDSPRMKLQCDNKNIADAIQHILFLAGYGSTIAERTIGSNDKPTLYVIPYNNKVKSAMNKTKKHYKGIVWCPTVDDGVVVFRKNGKIFISGNSQSAFSNITLEFGKPSDEIKNEIIVVGGNVMMEQYKDIPSKYFDKINNTFINAMAKGTGTIPFTFPLITIPITDDFDLSNKIFLHLLDQMYKWNGCYFENFRKAPFENEKYTSINPMIKPRNPEISRSLCPLTPEQEIIYWSEKQKEYFCASIKDVYRNRLRDNGNAEIYSIQNGKRIKAKINKFEESGIATIKLINGLEIRTTMNHLNKTLRGDEIETRDLTINDYLPISLNKIEGTGLSYNDGLLVGAFLGDGSYADNGIVYSLNYEGKLEFSKKITAIVEEEFGAIVTEYSQKSDLSGKYSCKSLRIKSKKLRGLIEDFVEGNSAKEKSLSIKSISKSIMFRRGIIDGLYETDGGNSNRIYSASSKMVKSLTTLFMSLGIAVRIDEDNREGRLSDDVCYCIRYYNPKNSKYKDVYILDEDYIWFKIKDIVYEDRVTSAYCLEILDNLDPIFSMANGIVTHNCRLQIDLELLSQVGGGIFGSSSGNTGAVQVLNANMNRLLMEYKYELNLDWDKFTNRLDYIFEVMQENHQRKRDWILNNKELFPTFFAFNKDLKNYFNVFAVSAMHEGLINIGYKEGMYDKEGKKIAHKIMQYIHTIMKKFITRDVVACGVEFAPNENCGVAFSRADVDYGKSIGIDVFVQGNKETKETYTTSGCMIPFSETDFIKQIENASEFQAYATSGSILHQFLEDKLPPEKLAKHIDNLFKKPIIYTTLTPTSTSCMSCGNNMVGKDAKDIHNCPVCGSDDLATFSKVIGYSKMISRKGIKINEYGKYEGEYNFWSNSRRIDWTSRKRITKETIDEISEKLN